MASGGTLQAVFIPNGKSFPTADRIALLVRACTGGMVVRFWDANAGRFSEEETQVIANQANNVDAMTLFQLGITLPTE